MTWLRLDDQFHRHRKVAPLSDAAFRLHVTVMLECSAQLTDGRIDCALVPLLPRAPSTRAKLEKISQELVQAGLWSRDGNSWVIHDFLDWNPSAEEVRRKREARAKAGKKGGIRSGEVRGQGKQTRSKLEAIASAKPKQNRSKIEAKSNPVPVPIPIGSKETNTIQDLTGCSEPSPGSGACADQPPEQTLQAMAEAFLRDRNDCALRYGLPGQWRALDPLFAAFDGTWGRDERPRGAADPRHAILAERLAEGFSVEELIEAVRGAKQDVHIARNRQFQVMRTILRDAAQVDKFRGLLKPANDSELAVEPVADTPSGTRWEEADAWSSA